MHAVLNLLWNERTPREKHLLSAGGVVLLAVLWYGVLWAPAARGRAALNASLPSLQRQLTDMQREAKEARELSAAVGQTLTGEALKDAIASSLTARGLANAQLQSIGRAVQVQLENVAFADWVAWLDDARRQLKVQVDQSKVTVRSNDGKEGREGQVDLTASLAPQ